MPRDPKYAKREAARIDSTSTAAIALSALSFLRSDESCRFDDDGSVAAADGDRSLAACMISSTVSGAGVVGDTDRLRAPERLSPAADSDARASALRWRLSAPRTVSYLRSM